MKKGSVSPLERFIVALNERPDSVEFEQTMALIDALYDFHPVAFRNGAVNNAAGQNNGSCKIFAFGIKQNLSASQTLACFGRFYREDVLCHPEGDDHQNIRQFMLHGWAGVQFDETPLIER
ncbi:HopJ type III effector protein [Vibrio sp. SM6]|uniref:HopJ type III effector protein n=1 Tax=Vibrio agarilyticus TaxID=2726741 RepID=A0A7X8TTV3_9VIBR|nr:HopJ type III effector protein [Vibrio agarilyticus]NLS14817.1 HopJ type III effector protein [Vibrio agarilyticus]